MTPTDEELRKVFEKAVIIGLNIIASPKQRMHIFSRNHWDVSFSTKDPAMGKKIAEIRASMSAKAQP